MEIDGVTARATSFIHRLQLHPEFYTEFKRVIRDFSTDKLNVDDVVSELDYLFKSHPDFLTDYRIFLSPRLPSPQQSPNNKCVTEANLEILNPCIVFMNKVQNRFANKRGVIGEYLETIRALAQGKLCNEEAYNAIANIFGNENQDLIDEFERLALGRKGIKKKKEKKEEKNSNRKCGDESKARKQIFKEDEMFELDINLYLRKKTVESANMLMNSAEEVINIDDYFSAGSIGYIKKVYKEEDSSIITRLRNDPRSVLPEILEKLESKEEVMIKNWRDLHEKKKNPVTKSSVLRSTDIV